MERTSYLFDIEGTLTGYNTVIDSEFKKVFLDFQEKHDVFLVTSMDYAKALEQLGIDTVFKSKIIFTCCGNEAYSGDQLFHISTWKPSGILLLTLEYQKRKSPFTIKTGKHLEVKTGCLTFSIVGRNATVDQRREYFEWDIKTQERKNICKRLSLAFPELEFVVSGDIGIDVYPSGKGKSQVKQWMKSPFVFVSTECMDGDWSLNRFHTVKNWKDTEKYIKTLD